LFECSEEGDSKLLRPNMNLTAGEENRCFEVEESMVSETFYTCRLKKKNCECWFLRVPAGFIIFTIHLDLYIYHPPASLQIELGHDQDSQEGEIAASNR
jgi:hypothetical protein